MPQVGAQAGAALRAATAVSFDPLLTVTELQRAVARDPPRWLGRTVRVRGRLGYALVRMCAGESACLGQPTLVDAAPVGATAPLPLVWGGPDPLRVTLHRLPLLGRLFPLLDRRRWGTPQAYLVRLDAVPATTCVQVACYSAVLLDVAPTDICYPRHRETPPFLCEGP